MHTREVDDVCLQPRMRRAGAAGADIGRGVVGRRLLVDVLHFRAGHAQCSRRLPSRPIGVIEVPVRHDELLAASRSPFTPPAISRQETADACSGEAMPRRARPRRCAWPGVFFQTFQEMTRCSHVARLQAEGQPSWRVVMK